jgi:hypothetical protein
MAPIWMQGVNGQPILTLVQLMPSSFAKIDQ